MNIKPMNRIDFIAIHASATPSGGKFENLGAADIRRWHREKGWRDIGYHFVIKRDGTLETGRPVTQPGAHEPKINRNSIAICLIGGAPPIGSDAYKKGLGENNYTPAQWKTLEAKVKELHSLHPTAQVIGHRDVPGVKKACPSFDAKAWWAGIKK